MIRLDLLDPQSFRLLLSTCFSALTARRLWLLRRRWYRHHAIRTSVQRADGHEKVGVTIVIVDVVFFGG